MVSEIIPTDLPPMGDLCELVTLTNIRGLHARAAAKFVQTVSQYNVSVQVQKDEVVVSGHSIMGLMMLAAAKGTKLKICAMGPEAPGAIMALSELVQRKFDEE